MLSIFVFILNIILSWFNLLDNIMITNHLSILDLFSFIIISCIILKFVLGKKEE